MNITRLQLLDSDVEGFLNIKGSTKVPLTFSVSDIRDISSRSGMFSKTINLTGDKNNNNILNNYFDVNIVAGTFDVNKRQKVAIVQNGVILRDNCFMRLLKVIKKQSVDTNIDEWVEYEVQVTDELGDFFKEVGNKEVKELDGWSKYKHIYGVDAVVESFHHTEVDGYKYTLPYISNDEFVMNDLMPGVYAKQIFDRIHSMNGFSYEWSTIDDEDTQFDKSILPYAGDKKKLTEEYINNVKVVADNLSTQETVKKVLGNGVSNGFIPSTPLSINNEIKDNLNKYNPTTGIYTNNLTVEAPNTLDYVVKIEYDIVFVNDYSYGISLTQAFQRFTSNLRIVDTNGSVLKHTNRLPLEVNPINTSISQYGTSGGEIRINHLIGQSWSPGETVVASGNETFNIPITSLIGTEELRLEVNASMNNSAGSQWRRTGTFDAVDMRMKIVIKSIEIEIAPGSQNGLMPGTEIDIKNFLPTKMKQSEFLKTIYQKYNLYVEVDPNEPSKLVYTSRDKFYDDGIVKDFTKKLHKKKEQELYFIPDITTKSMILSYKDDDKDALLDAYLGETSKTFGQVKVTFDNENIKGEERKDEVFSPTISMETEFGAVLPVLNADFKMNQRILQDGGRLACQQFTIKESESRTITSSFYPHLSMFNKPFNPTFSTEYAQSSFYAYNPQLITENNLYTLHWRRTLAQINSGKMLKAWFWLTEEDIQGLRMNDKIKVNNALYYINAVIDYDANSLEPTKVELLTVEDDLKLPRVGGGIKDVKEVADVIAGNVGPRVPSTPGGFFTGAISTVIKKRYDENVVVSGPTPLTGNLGMGNVLPNGFKGVIIGDNLKPTENGFYVNEGVKLTTEGLDVPSINTENLVVGGIKFEDGVMKFDLSYILDGYVEGGYFEAVSSSVGFEYDETTNEVIYKIEADKVKISNPVFTAGPTPTSTSDTSGVQGEFRFDDDYTYIKTSVGWKRSALNTF